MGETLQNDVVYVAVSLDVQESESTLLWALRRLRGRKICLLHIHRLPSLTPSSSWQEESEINAIQESQLKNSYDSLYKYRDICINKGVNEEDVRVSLISGYCVGEGIVELIYQNNITMLVMGVSAVPHYSRGMSVTSSKAKYVSQLAPRSCKMWFIYKGKRIKRKVGSLDLWDPSYSSSEFTASASIHETESPKEHSAKEFETMYYMEQRKNLETEETLENVKKEPEKRKSSNEDSSSPCSISDEPHPDFFCPISKEIMREPHVAADGFTYEEEEFRTWLSRGGQTSPKTGAKLDNHNLTPNFTLRSIINDWLQQHPNYHID